MHEYKNVIFLGRHSPDCMLEHALNNIHINVFQLQVRINKNGNIIQAMRNNRLHYK